MSEKYYGFIIANIATFRGWTFDCLKNYIMNRVDKGFFKWEGSIVARTSLTAAVGLGRLGLRGIGGFIRNGAKLIKSVFHDNL